MDSLYIGGLQHFLIGLLKAPSNKEDRTNNSTSVTSVSDQDPMSVFKYALRSSESRRQYPGRLKVFLDHIGLEGTIQEQAREFVKKTRRDPKWFQESLMKFIVYQKERVKQKEISEGTIGNYYKAVKLFCEMNFDQPSDRMKEDALASLSDQVMKLAVEVQELKNR